MFWLVLLEDYACEHLQLHKCCFLGETVRPIGFVKLISLIKTSCSLLFLD